MLRILECGSGFGDVYVEYILNFGMGESFGTMHPREAKWVYCKASVQGQEAGRLWTVGVSFFLSLAQK